MLTATLRVDGSSKFGKNNKYGYFPSFAAAWNMSHEKFFKVNFVNSLKMRLGWGKTGTRNFLRVRPKQGIHFLMAVLKTSKQPKPRSEMAV